MFKLLTILLCLQYTLCQMSLDEKKLAELPERLLMKTSVETKQRVQTPAEETKLSTTESKGCVVSTDQRCGKSFGNKICELGWCGKNNRCGTSGYYKFTHQATFDSVAEGNKGCGKPAVPVTRECVVSADHRCGKSFGNMICELGWCGKNNRCGTSNYYKFTHQATFDSVAEGNKECRKPAVPVTTKCVVSTDQRCGRNFGNKICGNGWCSRWHFCGTSHEHKASHQRRFDSVAEGNVECGKPAVPVTRKCVVSTDQRCGKNFGNTICGYGWCSRWHWCGTGNDYKDYNQRRFNSVAEGNKGCSRAFLLSKKADDLNSYVIPTVIKSKSVKVLV